MNTPCRGTLRPPPKEAVNVKVLSATLREQFDVLLRAYDRRLREQPAYAALPARLRKTIARRILEAVASWAENGDEADLLELMPALAQVHAAQGLEIGALHDAIATLEPLLDPLLPDMDTARRTWRAFFKIQALVSQTAVERLRATEIRLHQVVERSPVGIFHTTLEGAVLDANPAFFKIVGYDSLAEVNRVGMARLYADSADRERLLAQVAENPVTEFETRFKHAAGDIIWVAISVWLIQPPDAPPYLEGILEDITERWQVAQALRESEARYAALVNQAQDGVVLIQDNVITFANPALAAMLGYAAPEALLDTVFLDHVAPASRPLLAERVRRRLAGEEPPATYEAELLRRDGASLPVEIAGSVIEYQGKLTNLGLIRDITDRKNFEAQVHESLARRERQVQTSIEVSQEIAAAREVGELLHRVVTLVKERFGYYHAQIFRYDPAQDAVVLVVGYGEAGRQMLAAGHKVPMGRGVVGTAAMRGRPILATNCAADKDWRPNPFLPETKGELAAPIQLRDQVLGILDVQSDQVDALTAEDQLLLEGLCGQIALAMESTRLLEELRLSQEELSDALRIAHLGYWQFDVNAGMFTFNDQFYNIFHTTVEHEGGYQMSGERYATRFLHPDDAALVGAETELALASTEQHYTRTLEHRILYADGGVGYMSVYIHIDRDEEGHILHYYGVNEDITERKLSEMRVQETLQELERLYRATTREGWQVFRETSQLTPGYRFDGTQVRADADVWSPQVARAVQQNELVPPTADEAVAAAPLTVRGEIIGALGVVEDPARPLSADELALLQEIIEQGALALESARLYQDTQRRAAREQLSAQVTARMRASLDMETVLKTAVTEMRQALGLEGVIVQLARPETLAAGEAEEETDV